MSQNTNTNKVTITLHSEDGVPSLKDLQNAVRRLKDVEVPEVGTVESKGLTITVRPVAGIPPKKRGDVRVWLAENGHPEVVGKRGRIARDLLAKFEAAHA